MGTSAVVTHSSVSGVPLSRKLREYGQQCLSLVRSRLFRGSSYFPNLVADLHLYRRLAITYTGKLVEGCRVLEIGFGARPYRLYTLYAAGADITGVDLDAPVLRMRDIRTTYRRNGFERALKSGARYVLFDIAENRGLRTFLSNLMGKPFCIPSDRLVVSDAASPDFWRAHPGPYELIYSEDVFEHIPEADVERVVSSMRRALAPNGIAVISPMIFTGIMGGHLVELQGYRGGPLPAGIPPWDHLRKRTIQANTYLNELPRWKYRQIFSREFEIVGEVEVQPYLGAELLTPELRAELSHYPLEELLSNKVRFVLRARH